MVRLATAAVLLTLFGCARAGDEAQADAQTPPADAVADSRDFDFGPDPFEDAPARIDTVPVVDVPGVDTPKTSVDSMVSEDRTTVTDTQVSPEVGGCPTGLTDCGGTCVDTRSRVDHCGGCMRACSEVQRCVGGTCSSTTTCAAPERMCGAECVDVSSSRANCGACGRACATGAVCTAGACVPSMTPCATGSSDCDGNALNGCELMHGAAANSCASPMNLGTFCGDSSCGTFCPSTSWRAVGSQTDRRSRWFRARATECSNCISSLTARVTLTVPAGIDYDLFVYRPCGAQVGRSIAGAGATDQVTITESDSVGSDDAFDYFIEVRFVSGASCSPWMLTLEARANSASSC